MFFTPRNDGFVDLCPMIQRLFGEEVKCYGVRESFSRPPVLSERFAGSATWQFYSVLPSLEHFAERLKAVFCAKADSLKVKLACEGEAESLEYAQGMDVDFDVVGGVLTVTGVWGPDAKRDGGGKAITSRSVAKLREDEVIEVGVLQGEKAEEAEEMSLGGYLAVLGEDEGASKSHPQLHPIPRVC